MGTRITTNHHFTDKALTGVPKLLDDLQKLADDHESSDILFVVGREDIPVYAHRLILMARCRSFQNLKRGEICKIPGSTVTPSGPGQVTPIRLPHLQGSTFQEVLYYIYTGKDSAVFEVLSISQELGIDELRLSCEDHITNTLSIHNACTFLAAAVDLQERTSGAKGSRSFVDRCVIYIGENAIECVKTSAFLNLSKEALIRLVSSDFLQVEEDEVWRAVLSWAKHQAGVTQPTAHWTEEERVRVCQHLSGVINHVRLLLIDSQVFAEEVEPTGAVPMELSLERYRFAALPRKFSHVEDKRMQPRMSQKLFQGSEILMQDKSHYQRILNAWYGEPKQMWRLVYRASKHGYSAEAFHRHCDTVFPTMVLVLGTRGEVCGGCSDVPWGQTSTKGRYVASEKAFLFTLVNNQDIPPTKFDVVKKMFAIAHHSEYGPMFGAGADLCIASNCNANIESYSNLPHSYDGEGACNSILMGDYNFTVLDYEVFTTHGKQGIATSNKSAVNKMERSIDSVKVVESAIVLYTNYLDKNGMRTFYFYKMVRN